MEEISFDFNEGVQLDEIFASIKRLVNLRGCPSCGLNGFDFRLRVDPVIRFKELFESPNLARISIEGIQGGKFAVGRQQFG